VRGQMSDLVTKERADEFIARFPDIDFVDVGGAGHMVAGDRNDIFAGAVIDFLHRVVPLSGAPVQAPHTPSPHHVGPPGDVTDVP